MSRRFRRVVVVDWSAHATPKRGADSIWLCVFDANRGPGEPVNLPTRRAAADALAELCAAPGRSLVGFDFPFGFVDGFAAAAGFRGTPWMATWAHLSAALTDDERNRNNRWEVAADLNRRLGSPYFWGAPPRFTGDWLSATKPPPHLAALPPFRHVEIRLRDQGRRPFPASQLLGAGSVGSQALTGIPVAHRLRHHPLLAHRVRVWPFETGLVPTPCAAADDAVVLAEVWPSATEFRHVHHPVKDARQVIALAIHLGEIDAAGALAPLFAPDVPDRDLVTGEEGWVLGVS